MDSPGARDYLCAGEYLGYRLLELGVTHVFNVPGDFNLPLLDSLAKVPGLTLVNTCNELNSAYAADGFARATGGLGCFATTFLVGALSAINGVAASYAEEIPVLSIVGVPSTRQYQGMCSLHHTLGNAEDMSQEVDCYRPVTCYQTILRSFTDARYLIDKALTKALKQRKPVLLEVCRDIPMEPHSSFGLRPPLMTPFALPRTISDPAALEAAGAAVQRFFAGKKMPLIVAGRRVRTCQDALLKFASAVGWGLLVQHDAKGMFPEDHPSFIGCYFPGFSSPASIAHCYEAADAIFFVGTHFNEMNFGSPPDEALEQHSVVAYKQHVLVGHTDAFNGVATEELLLHLAGRLEPSSSSSSGGGILQLFKALPSDPPAFPHDPNFTAPPGVPLTLSYVYDQVQQQLLAGDEAMAVMVDTSDSMLRTHTMKLPEGTPYELQIFAGNIGWATPAGLGFSLAQQRAGRRRLLVCQGDGGLQMTAGEIGNYARCGSNAIIILVNNNGYLIERYLSPIPDSGYNYLPSWDYSKVAEGMCNSSGKYKVFKVTTEAQACAAIAAAKQLRGHFVFIEVVVDKRDAAPGAAALRQGFVSRHFSNIEGYRHLNLPGSTNANSTLTGGGLGGLTDTLAAGEVRSNMPAHAAGSSSCLPATAAAAEAAAAAAAALDARCSAAGAAPAGGGNGGGGVVVGETGRAAGAAGSSDGSRRSRLGLLPCKRHAEGQPEQGEQG
ncbi:hypothetical protein OEZ86_002005 [Tetradesmus obliquus]|nr:hypothetical protein OEZ86_002005 [Tetradesmus obliquus]